MSQLESVLNSEEKKLHDVSVKLWAGYMGRICGVEKFVIAWLLYAVLRSCSEVLRQKDCS